jgi:serine/threonine-protein kinase
MLRRPARFVVALPSNDALALADRPAIELSPDGTRLVYAAASGEGDTQLYQRTINQWDSIPIPNTRGATSPFFSPDGQSIGFFADGKLKRLSLAGGPPVVLSDALAFGGGTWNTDDTIIFSPTPTSGLMRIPAAGGTPQRLTTPESSNNERTHRWPQILPGGETVLFTIGGRSSPNYYLDARVAIVSLKTGRKTILFQGGTYSRYVPNGHIVYASEGGLFAVPFDPTRNQLAGPPVPVVQDVAVDTATGAAHFAASASAIAYASGPTRDVEGTLMSVDRRGNAEPLPAPPRKYAEPQVSRDGKRLAITIGAAIGRTRDIWIFDLGRATLAPFTFGPENFAAAVDRGQHPIVYASERNGRYGLYRKATDGSGTEEHLWDSPNLVLPTSVSSDGKFLAFNEAAPSTGWDIWVLSLQGKHTPQVFAQTPFDERFAHFSPDGRWVAYVSNESGRDEIYVRAFPGPGGKLQVSVDGGSFPVWGHSGRELFYRAGDKLMNIAVSMEQNVLAGRPRLIFSRSFQTVVEDTSALFDVTRDDQRVLMVQKPPAAANQVKVVLDWFTELQQRVPTR